MKTLNLLYLVFEIQIPLTLQISITTAQSYLPLLPKRHNPSILEKILQKSYHCTVMKTIVVGGPPRGDDQAVRDGSNSPLVGGSTQPRTHEQDAELVPPVAGHGSQGWDDEHS